MIFNTIQIKPESQVCLKTKKLILISTLLLFTIYYKPSTVFAIVDPLSSPNNKFGIHIISATPDETSAAAQLVNSTGGDWGYVTVLIESKDRKKDKWQTFFNDLRKKHLIPLVRLATEPVGSNWKKPALGEENDWANFLDSLVWPTKNRYIIVYNEPNQGQEWEGKVDPASYAQVLDKTITALKNKNPDFFVINGGFDASAPQKLPSFQDEANFLKKMDQEVPGIFNKLDGWTSHSYPNPGFAGSPKDFGRGTIKTWTWEMEYLKSLGLNKELPIFITETGWKHAEGIDFDKSLPSSETIGEYLKEAFGNIWNDSHIVAITPFLLNYQEAPFDHFSFKKLTGQPQNLKILGASYPEYYPHYQAISDLPKISGKPKQENKAELIHGGIYLSIVAGENYTIPITFKNTGQSVWNEYDAITLRAIAGEKELGIEAMTLPLDKKIEPGGDASFDIHLKAPKSGTFFVNFQLFNGSTAFDQPPITFMTRVQSPVILLVDAGLQWKKNFSGEYLLKITSDMINTVTKVNLDNNGKSKEEEARYLLPDQKFQFTLQKPFYKPKTIELIVQSGVNNLNFGILEPDFISALLKPKELWKLLPFFN